MTPQIEVTPEMIEAGVEVLHDSDFRFELRFDSDNDIVRLIFLAMLNKVKA